jgi:hypothetical protein
MDQVVMLAEFPEPCPSSKFETEPEDDQSLRAKVRSSRKMAC